MTDTPKKHTPAYVIAENVAGTNLRGEWDQVVSVKGGKACQRKKPCAKCPWRTDAVGEFSPEAFRLSAHTAYDMAEETFACHDSGVKNPALCAGFMLRGADHNKTVRIKAMLDQLKPVSDGGHQLFDNYRAMAVANGVDPADPVLSRCRD